MVCTELCYEDPATTESTNKGGIILQIIRFFGFIKKLNYFSKAKCQDMIGQIIGEMAKHLVVHVGHSMLEKQVESVGHSHTSVPTNDDNGPHPDISFLVYPDGVVIMTDGYMRWRDRPGRRVQLLP